MASDLLSKSLDEIISERRGSEKRGGGGKREKSGTSRGSGGGGGPMRREKKPVNDASAPFTSSTPSSKSVFVGTFSWGPDVSEEEQNAQVQSLFEEVGIRDVEEVSLEGKTGGNMFLLCRFSTHEQAKAAIDALNGKVVPFARKPVVAREDRGARAPKPSSSSSEAPSELAPFKVEIPNNRGVVGGGGGGGGRNNGLEPIIILKKSHPDHPSHASAGGGSGFRVKVDGIPWSFVDDELRKTFESCGKVLDARVARRRDGKSEGWGTVSYLKLSDMQRAIRDMDGAIIQGGGLGKPMTLVVTEDRK